MYEVMRISKRRRLLQITVRRGGVSTVYQHDPRQPADVDPKWCVIGMPPVPGHLCEDDLLDDLFAKSFSAYGPKSGPVSWDIDISQKALEALSEFSVGNLVRLRGGLTARITSIDQFGLHAGGRAYDVSGAYALSKCTDPAVSAYAAQFDIVSAEVEEERGTPQWTIKFASQADAPNKPLIITKTTGSLHSVIEVVYLNRVPVGLIVNKVGFVYYEDLTGGIPQTLPKRSAYSQGSAQLSSTSLVGLKRKITNRLLKIVKVLKVNT